MSTYDLIDDDWPHQHGTPDGYDHGCRSNGACPARQEYGLSCKSAKMRANTDSQFRKLLAAGATVPEIADALGLIGTNPTTPAPVTAKPKPKPRQVAAAVPEPAGPAPAPTTPAAATATAPDPDPAAEVGTPKAIRAWARDRGYTVHSTGAIPKDIVEHYRDVHDLPRPADQLPVNNHAPRNDAAHEPASAPAPVADQLPAPAEAPAQPRPDWSTINLSNDLATAIEQRDQARRIAVHLEQELHQTETQLATTAAHAHSIEHLAAALADTTTALAEVTAALRTTEHGLELVLRKWAEERDRADQLQTRLNAPPLPLMPPLPARPTLP